MVTDSRMKMGDKRMASPGLSSTGSMASRDGIIGNLPDLDSKLSGSNVKLYSLLPALCIASGVSRLGKSSVLEVVFNTITIKALGSPCVLGI